MASFSYQPNPFLLHLPSTHLISQSYLPQPNSLGDGVEVIPSENDTSFAKNQSSESSAIVDKVESGEQVTQKINSKEKKRKKRNVQFKNKPERREIKQKKLKEEKKVLEESPTDYIHVRARRGQATDSHSLAERVRREKISERMKMLQRLVPGCDKVTGKALVLDEIINYVQSLQNQVEFLSMKLSSVNPLSYQFQTHLDSFLVTPESMISGFTSHVSTISHPPTDHSSTLLLDQHHKSMPFSDNMNMMWEDEEDPEQKFIISPAPSNNFCSFI